MQLTKHWAALLDDYVIDLAWSPDGSQLAAASATGPITLYGATDGAKRHELPGHENGTNCLAWAPLAPKAEGRGQKEEVTQTQERSDPTSAFCPLPSALLLASGGQDGAVKFWDATAGQHTATTSLGSAWVEHLAWKPAPKAEGRGQKAEVEQTPAGSNQASSFFLLPSALLLAASGKNLSALRPDGSVAHVFKPAPKTISALAWQPAGGCAAVAYFGGVTLWDGDDYLPQKEFPYANGIHALVWSPDSRWLVSGNQDPSVHLWIPAEDIELQMSGYEGKVKELAYDHTSRWLATGGGKDCCVWDCSGAGPEGREPVMLPHEAKVCAVAFQHHHGLLATASQDGVVQLWSPERKQPQRATVKLPAPATKLAWSPDDSMLAIGSAKGAIYVLKCEA
jgi:WD40 repeat protein